MWNQRLWIFSFITLAGLVNFTLSQSQAYVSTPIVGAKIGSSTNFTCESTGTPIVSCLWERVDEPGQTSGGKPFILNFFQDARQGSPSTEPGYSYIGGGLDRGQCGLMISNIKERDNSKWQCTLVTRSGIYRGIVDVSILRRPDPPRFTPAAVQITDDDPRYGSAGQAVTVTCHSSSGQPPPKFQWFLGDQAFDYGLDPINTTYRDNVPITFQTMQNRRFTWVDHGKRLRCKLVHDALAANDISEAFMDIQVRFAPRSEGQTSASTKVYVPTIGGTQVLAMNISANPRPRVDWDIDGIKITENAYSPDRHFQTELREVAAGVYEARLIISNVQEDDLVRMYKLQASNTLGIGHFEIKISSTDPSEGLSAGGIVGLVLGIPAFLILIAVIVVYARARGLLCFKADDGTSSEKERMDEEGGAGGGNETAVDGEGGEPKKPAGETATQRITKTFTNFYVNLKAARKKDKTSPVDEEATKQSEKEKEKEPGTEGAAEEKKPDDIVYAELDLTREGGGGGGGNPLVRPADDKTEYAEIVGVQKPAAEPAEESSTTTTAPTKKDKSPSKGSKGSKTPSPKK